MRDFDLSRFDQGRLQKSGEILQPAFAVTRRRARHTPLLKTHDDRIFHPA
jgi:hypothetical protein